MKDSLMAGIISVFTSMGFMGFLFRWQHSKTDKVDKKADENQKAISSLDDKYLTEKEHTLLCENSTLRLEQSFETHFSSLKDDVFKSIRSLEDTIKGQNNG